MKSVVGRRVFVGSVVAGLPLVAGVGVGALAQSRTSSRGGGPGAQGDIHAHQLGAGADPVIDHLLREMAAIHNRARREVRGEDARAFAGHLRTLVVYARQQDFDGRIRAAAREAVDREGRQAVVWRDPDPAATRAELEHYGVEVDPRLQDFAPAPDFNRRNAALDTLLREGITGSWERMARVLQRAAPELDRRTGTVLRVALAQTDEEWKKGFCEQLWNEIGTAKDIVLMQCAMLGIPVIGQYFGPACAAAELTLAVLMGVYAAYC